MMMPLKSWIAKTGCVWKMAFYPTVLFVFFVCCWMSMFPSSLADDWSPLPAKIHSTPFDQKSEQTFCCILCQQQVWAMHACANLTFSTTTIRCHIFAAFPRLNMISFPWWITRHFCVQMFAQHLPKHTNVQANTCTICMQMCAHRMCPILCNNCTGHTGVIGSQIGNSKPWSVSSARSENKEFNLENRQQTPEIYLFKLNSTTIAMPMHWVLPPNHNQ